MKKEYIALFTALLTLGTGIANHFLKSGNIASALTLYCATIVFISIFFLVKTRTFNGRNINLSKHYFFERMNYWIKYKIPHLEIGSDLRTKFIRERLLVKYMIGRDLIQNKMIASKDMSVTEQTDIFVEIIGEYEKEWKAMHTPDIFINKFNEWHKEHTDRAISRIKDVCTSGVLNDNEKKISLLDIYLTTYDITLTDSEKTLVELNGVLENEFKKMRKEGKL